MTGWIYKEWKQNKEFLLWPCISGITPFLSLFFFRDLTHFIEDINVCRALGLIMSALPVLLYGDQSIMSDNRKLWAYFVTTTSESYRGFLRVKYETIFAMISIQSFSIALFDELYMSMANDRGIEGVLSLSGGALTMAVLLLYLFAIEFPVLVRFGQRKGEILMMIFHMLLTLIVVILAFLNIDFLIKLGDMGLTELIKKLLSDKVFSFISSLFSVGTLILYYVSYRLSCRFYLKGADGYAQ